MEKYNILYYYWNEITYEDGVEALKKLGHKVFVTDLKFKTYDNDETFLSSIASLIKENSIDVIFSFNYFPDLSRAAMDARIRYVSWCFDSPHLILNSVTLGNSCNTVNIFDYALAEKLLNRGISTVRYMPLACNVERVQRSLQHKFAKDGFAYKSDITFLGSMYDDEYNFFDKINHLPPYVKGYLDAVIEAQLPIYGMDMVEHLLRGDICDEIFKYINIGMGKNYVECKKDVLISIVQKKITSVERRRLLTVIGENYRVDHYAGTKAENLPVNYKGYASYINAMPEIFATSKINLNITLRSILTGIPLRVLDIIGAGGFCITNYQSELSNYFENDKSIVWYESYEDLFEKIAFYLKNDSSREAIVKSGNDIVSSQFSYDKLMPEILK